MMKMEIKLDRNKLEALGYNWDLSYKILCENFERAGFIKEVHTEDGTLIYRGTDSPKDFSYFGLIFNALVEQIWFRDSVCEWFLYDLNTTVEKWKKQDCIAGARRRCKRYGW